MHVAPIPKLKSHRMQNRPPFERIALILQGGGALGAYQAGVYQALAEANLHPDAVAGISIGAVNSALIAGNPPEKRVEALRNFWDFVSASPFGLPNLPILEIEADIGHRVINQLQALTAMLFGAPNFFTPRLPPPMPFARRRSVHAELLRRRSAQSDARAAGRFRPDQFRARCASASARSTCGPAISSISTPTTHRIGPEHIMASGSLPPGFPATEIEGELLLGRRPRLEHAAGMGARDRPRQDTLAFQVDLWSARGRVAARPDRSRDAPEGDPLFEPHPRRTDSFKTDAVAAARRGKLLSSCRRSCATRPGGGTARRSGR